MPPAQVYPGMSVAGSGDTVPLHHDVVSFYVLTTFEAKCRSMFVLGYLPA